MASGGGELRVDGEPYVVDRPGAHLLRRHEVSVSGVLSLEPGPGVEVHATVFSPGLAQG